MTSSYLKIRRRIRDLVAVFLAVIIIAVGFSAYRDYRLKTEQLFKESRSHVRIIAEHASRTFGEVDRVLDIVINKVLTPEKLKSINEKLLYDAFLSAQKETPQILSIYFADAAGTLAASSLEYPIKRINLSDREFFRHHRDTPGDAPFISRPYINRISNKWNFVFSQRISNPDGSFAGIIGASLDTAYFELLYAEQFNDVFRNISLVREDGFPIVMYPQEDKAVALSLKSSSMFATHLPLAPIGVYREEEGADNGSARMIAYCRLPANYPLVARITYDWNSIDAAWRRETSVKALLVILYGALAVWLSRLLMRRLYDLEQSEEQRALLGLIVEQSPVSVVVTDPEGGISYVNPRFSSLTGYTAKEAKGKNPRILKSGVTSPDTYRDMWAKLSSGREWVGELCNIKKDGTLYWEQAHMFPVCGEDNVITHYAAVKEDISERKQFEEELQRTKKVAEAANSAKSEFLANMSHEIRTPMNAITGMAHLTLQTDLDPRQRDYVSKILNASESLLGIINDILDFSKIEAGKLELETVTFDLSELLRHVGNIASVKAEEKGIEVKFTLSPDVPRQLVGDPLKLGQILTNLAGNSVKFTEQGEVVIAVEIARRTALSGRVYLTFSVTDTGIGMDDEQIGRIFAPFSQVDSSIARRYGGTGLGLSIVKRLVDLMGGSMEVVSHLNQGSRFSFTIELGVAAENTETGTGAFSRLPRALEVELKRIKGAQILLVEDNPINQQVAAEILRQAGMVVTVAASGREALDSIGAVGELDLLFMDIQLPDMDGFELTALIRGEQRFAELPIIAMTAHALSEVRENCLAAGMNGHVVKPINPHELREILVRWIHPWEVVAAEAEEVTAGDDFVFPVSLPGVNVPRVLERIGGDGRLLQRLLSEFCEQHQNSVAAISGAIEADDLEKARRLLHALKGESGNLGADTVFAATIALEGALRAKRSDALPTLLLQLQQAMDELFAALHGLDKNRPAREMPVRPGADAPLGEDELVLRLNGLAELLRRNKSAAAREFKELMPYLPDSPELFALEEQISRLDFKKGLLSLKQLAQQLHVTLEERR